ncbi:endolytic transglycosylase MltG [Legionella israelensis]|uniref:Endolytic murein transglycosylase n=1 Tax=Legionella israelensis TaxID=454 RepID=A0A0W0VHB5_9GAMM|nr:endolytic transglycosylase MltG [Legionella israelensis]KTD19482.1 periplasmic solute-binding protein [Legionella israelensis]QBS08420.1 endolytic transglycosylase MltG [Legionella israelensis]SCX91626.1 UPF0755 protein [Legionella israelensis DSM 19235]STX58056.1 putative periplasmic solute-binding protein [Legionella israelensis]
MEKNWLKKLIIYSSVFLFFAASVLLWDMYRLVKKPMLSVKQEPLIINLENQTSANQFVKRLKKKHLIRSGKLFLLIIRMQGFSKELKAGIYKVYPGESAQQFLYRVVRGDVLTESFQIIEGSNITKISTKLEKSPYLTYTSDVWKRIAGNHLNAEGLLLADTYQYQAGSHSFSLLHQANQKLKDYLDFRWANRDKNLPYRSSYQLLIAASILEKEASIPREKKIIAGIMVNRLKKSMPLQMDPTVIYALGSEFKGKLSRSDLQVDSPYNTYRYPGLPPTPIAMVGKDAIDAAAHPEFTEYFYFVAKGDGSHHFSKTYDQHRKAVLHYQIKD